jgi:hypothetical protein
MRVQFTRTEQVTAGSVGPSVEFDFTEFRYPITPDDFQKFTVTCAGQGLGCRDDGAVVVKT